MQNKKIQREEFDVANKLFKKVKRDMNSKNPIDIAKEINSVIYWLKESIKGIKLEPTDKG